jgi:Zn-dependent protease with chaperone function
MFEEETKTVEKIVVKLANEAKLEKVPKIEISKEWVAARANFRSPKITISEAVLTKWKEGEMNTDDIEILIAHEIGHLIDFQKGLRSVSVQSATKIVLYIFAVFVSFLASTVFFSAGATLIFGLISLFALITLLYSFPYEIRKWALRAQLEADKNAYKLVDKKRFAIDIVSGFRLSDRDQHGIKWTWMLLLNTLVWPRVSERLKNLSIKPEDIEVGFREQLSKT